MHHSPSLCPTDCLYCPQVKFSGSLSEPPGFLVGRDFHRTASDPVKGSSLSFGSRACQCALLSAAAAATAAVPQMLLNRFSPSPGQHPTGTWPHSRSVPGDTSSIQFNFCWSKLPTRPWQNVYNHIAPPIYLLELSITM